MAPSTSCQSCPCHAAPQSFAMKPKAFARWPASAPTAASTARASTSCRASAPRAAPGGDGAQSRDASASSTSSGSSAGASAAAAGASFSASMSSLPAGDFCIIESREAVKDFEKMQLTLEDLTNNIMARQSRIFLLMEEVRRLRIQQRLQGGEVSKVEELAIEKYVSALPLLPPLTSRTLNTYYYYYACFVGLVIVFGGILAPILELKLGLGGTSYSDFVNSLHLPRQLAQVDPIVASFCGGSVGVLSALLVVEINNVKKQQRNRCHYCEGTGYLSCGACVGTGRDEGTQCACCSGSGKVMCTSCLCTGKQMATEHDPRIDPFSA